MTKELLNQSFVDLEATENVKFIYNIRHLGNNPVQIEPPGKIRGITQCKICQQTFVSSVEDYMILPPVKK